MTLIKTTNIYEFVPRYSVYPNQQCKSCMKYSAQKQTVSNESVQKALGGSEQPEEHSDTAGNEVQDW